MSSSQNRNVRYTSQSNANDTTNKLDSLKGIGIIMIICAVIFGVPAVLVFGIILVVVGIIVKKYKSAYNNLNGEIRSGSIQNSKNSAPESSYMNEKNSRTKMSGIHENSSECPICKSYSPMGFCNYCGFKFK